VNLSISSSNKYWLKSLLLVFLVFAAYSSMLKIVKPKVTAFQNQWVQNYSIAEVYMYKPILPSTVIVGSSMSAKLLEEEFSDSVYNLSFAGGSALTGLNLIKKKNHIPRLILIETNTIELPTNYEMLNDLFTPFIWRLKRYITSLQYTYQPINIILSVMKKQFDRSDAEKIDEKPNYKLLESILVRRMRQNKKADDIFEGRKELLELKKLVVFFSNKGTQIVFFKIPVHSTILASKRYIVRKTVLHKIFADMQVDWLKNPSSYKFETSDGLHLLFKGARDFSRFLNSVIEDFLQNNLNDAIAVPRQARELVKTSVA